MVVGEDDADEGGVILVEENTISWLPWEGIFVLSESHMSGEEC